MIVEDIHESNEMSVILLRAGNGDIIFVYMDQYPGLPFKSMVMRRSRDESQTWGRPDGVAQTGSP